MVCQVYYCHNLRFRSNNFPHFARLAGLPAHSQAFLDEYKPKGAIETQMVQWLITLS